MPIGTVIGPSVTGAGYKYYDYPTIANPQGSRQIPTVVGPSASQSGNYEYSNNYQGPKMTVTPPPPEPKVDNVGNQQVTMPSIPNEVMESRPPEPPSFEQQYGGFFDEALSNLTNRQNQMYNEYMGETQGIDAQTQAAKQNINQQLGLAQQQLTSQEEKSKQLANEQENQQRSQLAEVRQGLTALYGTGTATGPALAELASRTAFQNIGKIRSTYAGMLNDINFTRMNAVQQANTQLTEADLMSMQLKRQAKSEYDKNLFDIQNSRTLLARDRAQMKNESLQRYAEQIQAIDARNSAFRQQIYLRMMDFQNNLKENEISISRNYSNDLNTQIQNAIKAFPANQGYSTSYSVPIGAGRLTVSKPKDTENAESGTPSLDDLSKGNYGNP